MIADKSNNRIVDYSLYKKEAIKKSKKKGGERK
jgi:hypothetical protein